MIRAPLPPLSARPGGRFRRTFAFVILLFAGLAIYAFFSVGKFLAREDPLTPGDAIFVLAGTRVERPLEAADLFHAGYAPRIVISRAEAEPATFQLEKRGITLPTDLDLTKDLLMRLGVPEQAVIAPERIHDNTAEEAQTLRDLALERKWRRIIVVSSTYHLRRVSLAFRRALRGTDVEVVVRGSRFDESTPERWWSRRSDIRWLATEIPKLIAYSLGFGA